MTVIDRILLLIFGIASLWFASWFSEHGDIEFNVLDFLMCVFLPVAGLFGLGAALFCK
jgi:hypothetical protein